MKRAYAVIGVVLAALLLVAIFALVFWGQQVPESEIAQNYSFSVIETLPHDNGAWTEGLAFDNNGSLFEGTGEFGASQLRQVDLTTGNVLQVTSLSDELYGEGIAVVGSRIVQLTWKNQVGFVYDKQTFRLLQNFSYSGEGWGLTFDGSNLIMSNGSDKLTFLDPSTFQIVRQLSVHDGNVSVTQINELEFVNGDLYANIWLEGKMAIINLGTGQVKGWVNFADLEGDLTYDANGIAYNQQNNRLYITGKYWQHLYQITIESPA